MTVIQALIYIIVLIVLLWLAHWAITNLGVPEPLGRFARVAIVVVGIIAILMIILGVLGMGPGINLGAV